MILNRRFSGMARARHVFVEKEEAEKKGQDDFEGPKDDRSSAVLGLGY